MESFCLFVSDLVCVADSVICMLNLPSVFALVQFP
jgi:hypothetical protein